MSEIENILLRDLYKDIPPAPVNKKSGLGSMSGRGTVTTKQEKEAPESAMSNVADYMRKIFQKQVQEGTSIAASAQDIPFDPALDDLSTLNSRGYNSDDVLKSSIAKGSVSGTRMRNVKSDTMAEIEGMISQIQKSRETSAPSSDVIKNYLDGVSVEGTLKGQNNSVLSTLEKILGLEDDSTEAKDEGLMSKSGMDSTFVEGPLTGPDDVPITKSDTKGLMSNPLTDDELPYSTGIVEGSTKEVLLETQSRLKDLGFYGNKVDGVTGSATKSAIKTFQHKNDLEVTGTVDEQTRLKLAESKGLIEQEKPQTTLLSFISKGEGGYGAANNGTSKLAKKFSMSDGYYSDVYNKPLTEMTVNEIMNAQVGTTGKTTEELLKMNPESVASQKKRDLFAAGAYQIIPKTMWAAARQGAVEGSDLFAPKIQDKIAMDFLAGSDRPKLRDFLAGDPNVSVEDAMLDLAQQWASAPAHKDMTTSGGRKIKKGDSYYGSGNKAQHTVAETKAMLLQARDENTL